jgi:hypothetical protein
VRVKHWGLTRNLGGAGVDGRGGGRDGRERQAFGMGAPSIGPIAIRNTPQRFPQRCVGANIGQYIRPVNNNCHSPVRYALLTCAQTFRSYPQARTLPAWTVAMKYLKVLRNLGRLEDTVTTSWCTGLHGGVHATARNVQSLVHSQQIRSSAQICTRWLTPLSASEERISIWEPPRALPGR